jgi:Uma2 family endonuclease
MSATARKRMTAREFLAWAEAQPYGKRYRLIDGEPVAMAPERSRQGKEKFRAAKALEAAVERAGLPCHVLPDGITVLVDEYAPYEPDAGLYCGAEIDDEATILKNPLIIVEVLSPSTTHVDTGAKLAG